MFKILIKNYIVKKGTKVSKVYFRLSVEEGVKLIDFIDFLNTQKICIKFERMYENDKKKVDKQRGEIEKSKSEKKIL